MQNPWEHQWHPRLSSLSAQARNSRTQRHIVDLWEVYNTLPSPD